MDYTQIFQAQIYFAIYKYSAHIQVQSPSHLQSSATLFILHHLMQA